MKEQITEKYFEQLFKQYFVPLVAFARKYVTDTDSATEVVHKVFIKIWEKRLEINPDKGIKTYLYTSVYHLSMNHLRYVKKFDGEPLEKANSLYTESGQSNMEFTELEEKVLNAINTLPDKCKEVFILNRYDELTYQQISEKLNISIKTVEGHITKALKVLRIALQDEQPVQKRILLLFFL